MRADREVRREGPAVRLSKSGRRQPRPRPRARRRCSRWWPGDGEHGTGDGTAAPPGCRASSTCAHDRGRGARHARTPRRSTRRSSEARPEPGRSSQAAGRAGGIDKFYEKRDHAPPPRPPAVPLDAGPPPRRRGARAPRRPRDALAAEAAPAPAEPRPGKSGSSADSGYTPRSCPHIVCTTVCRTRRPSTLRQVAPAAVASRPGPPATAEAPWSTAAGRRSAAPTADLGSEPRS